MNKVRRYVTLLLGALCLTGTLQAQQRLRIMTYNVENLFDTLHTAGREDHSFTPAGEHAWSSRRYWGKLGKLARVIAATGQDRPADLVALVEVENDSVLSNLTRRTKLHRLGYQYIITHSPDTRGINVALLYQPPRFRPIKVDTLRFMPPAPKVSPTRDMLHVAGELTSGDTLDILICHWPSKRGGRPAARFRNLIGKRVRQYFDSLNLCRRHPAIVLTGDFNALYPEDCLTTCLKAALPNEHPYPDGLYMLSHDMTGRADVRGTYKYRGEWNQLDRFFVNGALLQYPPSRRDALWTSRKDCYIVDFPFLLKASRDGRGTSPYRSYLGTFYQGGYSDHLPLVLDLFYSYPR